MILELGRRGLGFSVAVVSAVFLSTAAAYEAFHGPTELVYSVPEKVAPGYLLFAAWAQNEAHEYVYLVDIEGNVVHKWKAITPEYEGRGYSIEKTARFTEKGTVVLGLSTAILVPGQGIAPCEPIRQGDSCGKSMSMMLFQRIIEIC